MTAGRATRESEATTSHPTARSDSHRVDRQPVGRRDEAAPRDRAPGVRVGLPGLQRSAGNAAVAGLVVARTPTAGPPVQRTSLADALRTHLQGPAERQPVAQRDLAADLRANVEITGPVDDNKLMALIRAASAADRMTAVADAALMALIGSRLSARSATTIASALLEGTRKWKNPVANDFFRFFVEGTGSGPASPRSTMNCWESIIYAAYLVGAVDAAWIKRMYLGAIATPDATQAIFALLGYSSFLPELNQSGGPQPFAGQLVFYTTRGSYPDHVALSVGGGQVMSLWNQPSGIDSVQRIAITDLPGTIRYGNPPW